MMNVSAWSIRNPIPAVMLFVLLTLAGLLSFNAMKVQNFPDIDLPTVTVTASLPGAAPAQLETEVARKIENAIATAAGPEAHLHQGAGRQVTITAEFRLEKPTQEAVDDVRSAPCSGAQRPARRPARPGRQQDEPGGRAHAGLHHRAPQPHGRRGPELVCGQHRRASLLAVRGVGSVSTAWAA
jgi:multidrug efflux pump subunit AcrB